MFYLLLVMMLGVPFDGYAGDAGFLGERDAKPIKRYGNGAATPVGDKAEEVAAASHRAAHGSANPSQLAQALQGLKDWSDADGDDQKGALHSGEGSLTGDALLKAVVAEGQDPTALADKLRQAGVTSNNTTSSASNTASGEPSSS